MSKERFDKSVDILVKAYLNDTLVHGNCYACAVGNLVAAGLGVGFVEKPMAQKRLRWDNGALYPGSHGWGLAFCTDEDTDDDGKLVSTQDLCERWLQSEAVSTQIEATGYDWLELARVEYAFESAEGKSAYNKDVWMFNGLMAVITVLASIDNISLEHTEEARKMFVKT